MYVVDTISISILGFVPKLTAPPPTMILFFV